MAAPPTTLRSAPRAAPRATRRVKRPRNDDDDNSDSDGGAGDDAPPAKRQQGERVAAAAATATVTKQRKEQHDSSFACEALHKKVGEAIYAIAARARANVETSTIRAESKMLVYIIRLGDTSWMSQSHNAQCIARDVSALFTSAEIVDDESFMDSLACIRVAAKGEDGTMAIIAIEHYAHQFLRLADRMSTNHIVGLTVANHFLPALPRQCFTRIDMLVRKARQELRTCTDEKAARLQSRIDQLNWQRKVPFTVAAVVLAYAVDGYSALIATMLDSLMKEGEDCGRFSGAELAALKFLRSNFSRY